MGRIPGIVDRCVLGESDDCPLAEKRAAFDRLEDDEIRAAPLLALPRILQPAEHDDLARRGVLAERAQEGRLVDEAARWGVPSERCQAASRQHESMKEHGPLLL